MTITHQFTLDNGFGRITNYSGLSDLLHYLDNYHCDPSKCRVTVAASAVASEKMHGASIMVTGLPLSYEGRKRRLAAALETVKARAVAKVQGPGRLERSLEERVAAIEAQLATEKCATPGCQNRRSEGKFAGNVCAPCNEKQKEGDPWPPCVPGVQRTPEGDWTLNPEWIRPFKSDNPCPYTDKELDDALEAAAKAIDAANERERLVRNDLKEVRRELVLAKSRVEAWKAAKAEETNRAGHLNLQLDAANSRIDKLRTGLHAQNEEVARLSQRVQSAQLDDPNTILLARESVVLTGLPVWRASRPSSREPSIASVGPPQNALQLLLEKDPPPCARPVNLNNPEEVKAALGGCGL